MKNNILLYIFLSAGTNLCLAKPNDSIGLGAWYFGIGMGQGIGGGLLGWTGKFKLSNNWGFTMNKQINARRKPELPSDYKSTGLNKAKPSRQFLDIFSINILRHIPSANLKHRWGFEGGPSIIKEKTPIYKKNNNFSPTTFGNSNYIVSYNVQNAWGFNAKATYDIPIETILGLSFSVTAHLNKLRSSLGYEIYFNFGFMGKTINH